MVVLKLLFCFLNVVSLGHDDVIHPLSAGVKIFIVLLKCAVLRVPYLKER